MQNTKKLEYIVGRVSACGSQLPTLGSRFLLALAFLLLASSLYAASPRERLLSMVPEDVSFCLVVQNLRQHAATLADSPFIKSFQKSQLGQSVLGGQEAKQLVSVEKFLKEHMHVDFVQLRDDILGDAVVLAYRPGPPGKPEQEQGIVLLQARDAKLLTHLIARINEMQKESGELTRLDERTHQGVTYFRRICKKDPPFYYWQQGPVLAASGQESMLQRAIDLSRKPAGRQLPPLALRFQELKADKALLALWINPRAFDEPIEQKLKTATGPEAFRLKVFTTYWKALDGAAVTVTPRKDLELGLTLKARTGTLPPGVRKFFAEAARPSELWNTFPDDALLAVAGRVDAAALVELVSEFLEEKTRQQLREGLEKGKFAGLARIAKTVLPNIGPDVGFCVTAPPASDKNWPPRLIAAVKVQPGGKGIAADQTMLFAVHSLAVLGVIDHNLHHADRLTLKSEKQEGVEVRYLENSKEFQPGVRPAYALKAGYLLLASSPETIRGFQPPAMKTAPSSGEVPLVRISLSALRTYLQERRDNLAAYVAKKDKITPEEAGKRLDGVQRALELFKRVELTQKAGEGLVTWTLRICPTQPMAK